MSLHLECTVCKEADLSEVASGVLECGHIYCAECIYKLWHAETAAASARKEARAHQARLRAQTRAQIQAHGEADTADNGRNLICPCCQKSSSVDSVRRVFLSSSQAPSTAPATSPQTLTRSTSQSSASAEEVVEDLSAQLATALEYLDAAHAHAAESARAHDLHMQRMQTQLMEHAEQVHQSQVQGLAETNAQLHRDLSNAQAQLNHAAREVREMRDQYGRAVQELSLARDKERKAKARVSDAMVKTRDAAMDRLADKLSANGSLGAPLRGGTQPTETARPISTATQIASAASSNINKPRESSSARNTAPSPRSNRLPPAQAPEATPKSPGSRNRAPVTATVQLNGASVSSGTRYQRNEEAAAESIRARSPTGNRAEQRPRHGGHSEGNANRQPTTSGGTETPKRQTRATTSAKTSTETRNLSRVNAAAPILDSARTSLATSNDDYSGPANQRLLRKRALAEGRRWPLDEKIIVPACKPRKKHDFSGLGSNGTYLKYHCKTCKWGCEERTPDGYVPVRKR
ncbi:hypothetical protein D9619_012039 [Psilocybe cf. subviscida]|uniref:RING-type domain-containing protein n=1 Tax=Psilocybe cf. subviscida TaxID=2480587 RepID=A0A8H5EZC9_9AGAR|nr:hypothetical protein D9619_012039 [Psilocybe cf. subviscida]